MIANLILKIITFEIKSSNLTVPSFWKTDHSFKWGRPQTLGLSMPNMGRENIGSDRNGRETRINTLWNEDLIGLTRDCFVGPIGRPHELAGFKDNSSWGHMYAFRGSFPAFENFSFGDFRVELAFVFDGSTSQLFRTVGKMTRRIIFIKYEVECVKKVLKTFHEKIGQNEGKSRPRNLKTSQCESDVTY